MIQRERASLIAAGRAEFIPLLPTADKVEIVGQTLALSAGIEIDPQRLNPLGRDLARSGTSLANVMDALGGTVQAAITSTDLGAAVSEALRIITLSLTTTRDLEHRRIAKMFAVSDFREQSIPFQQPVSLAPIGESGEIPGLVGSIGWASCQLETIGGILNFSRQSVLNADWGLLASFAKEMIAAADRQERAAIIGILNSNPTLADGVQMFDAARGNIATETGPPSVTTLSSAVDAMAQLAENNAPLGLKPALIVVPASLAVSTAVLLDAGLDRMLGGSASPIVYDASLTDAWYLLPDPERRPALGLAHLANARDPLLDRRPQFSADSIGIRCRHSYGATALSPHAVKILL